MEDLEGKKLANVPVVVLDTETTGLFPWLGHRIVEIAALRLENWKQVGELNELLNPGRKMDPKASAINGIYDEDLLGKPHFAEIYEQLAGLTEGALLVAHNATFDAGFLGMEAHIGSLSHGVPTLSNPWLCTLQLARRHFYFGSNSLSNVARKLGVPVGRAHRAMNDVHITAKVLKKMVRTLEKRRLKTVGDLLHAQGGPIYAPATDATGLPKVMSDALEKKQRLRILYVSEYGESERIISPNYASQNKGVTYLIAYCHLRKSQRTFRLDRIFNAELVGER